MPAKLPLFDPFGAAYFAAALSRAADLAGRRSSGSITNYEIVSSLGDSQSRMHIGRRQDGSLWVLKGYPTGGKVAAWQSMRETEAVRMAQLASDYLLHIGETLSLVSDSLDFLCLPYCQGGSEAYSRWVN